MQNLDWATTRDCPYWGTAEGKRIDMVNTGKFKQKPGEFSGRSVTGFNQATTSRRRLEAATAPNDQRDREGKGREKSRPASTQNIHSFLITDQKTATVHHRAT